MQSFAEMNCITLGAKPITISNTHSVLLTEILFAGRSLPDLDGFELCRQMRCYDSNMPILFFSGAGGEADKKMDHQAGANAYVSKPNVSHLLGSIARFIPRAKSARG